MAEFGEDIARETEMRVLVNGVRNETGHVFLGKHRGKKGRDGLHGRVEDGANI